MEGAYKPFRPLRVGASCLQRATLLTDQQTAHHGKGLTNTREVKTELNTERVPTFAFVLEKVISKESYMLMNVMVFKLFFNFIRQKFGFYEQFSQNYNQRTRYFGNEIFGRRTTVAVSYSFASRLVQWQP